MNKLAKIAVLLFTHCCISACRDFSPPPEIDPTPYLGCYENGQSTIRLYSKNLYFDNSVFNSKIVREKVGPGVVSSFRVAENDLVLRAEPTKSPYFYRFSSVDGVISIVIADRKTRVHVFKKHQCVVEDSNKR
jgi:hypothetical protein